MFLGLPIFPGVSEHNQMGRIVEMLGPPPDFMLDHGTNTNKYFRRKHKVHSTQFNLRVAARSLISVLQRMFHLHVMMYLLLGLLGCQMKSRESESMLQHGDDDADDPALEGPLYALLPYTQKSSTFLHSKVRLVFLSPFQMRLPPPLSSSSAPLTAALLPHVQGGYSASPPAVAARPTRSRRPRSTPPTRAPPSSTARSTSSTRSCRYIL